MNVKEINEQHNKEFDACVLQMIALFNSQTAPERAKNLMGLAECNRQHRGMEAAMVHRAGKIIARVTLECGWNGPFFSERVEAETAQFKLRMSKMMETIFDPDVPADGLRNLLEILRD